MKEDYDYYSEWWQLLLLAVYVVIVFAIIGLLGYAVLKVVQWILV